MDKKELHTNVPVVLFLGYGRVGKDTASDYLVQKYGYTRKASGDKMRELQESINPVIEHRFINTDELGIEFMDTRYKRYKEWQDIYGYSGAKDNVSGFRQSLVDLAESMKKVFGDEVWINTILPLGGKERGIVISDGRNRYEAMRVLNYGGIIIRLTRNGVEAANNTEKESIANTMNLVHETIENNGTKEELYKKLDDIMSRYRSAINGSYRQ